MTYLRAKKFEKSHYKLTKKIKEAFSERFKLFTHDKYHPLLKNHKLNPPYDDCRSIDVTGDIRAIYKDLNPDTVLFVNIGPHNKLYE